MATVNAAANPTDEPQLSRQNKRLDPERPGARLSNLRRAWTLAQRSLHADQLEKKNK